MKKVKCQQLERKLWNNLLPYLSFLKENLHLIVADLSTHQMYILVWNYIGFQVKGVYRFSSSKAPICCLENSGGTPTGLHRICEKIGYNVPENGEFIARKFTGQQIPQANDMREKAKIVTRILRLRGCEWGINRGVDIKTHRFCDTYKRCVYIHGTNLERFIPQPLSQGCLLLKTKDLLEVFETVYEGDLCWIGYL